MTAAVRFLVLALVVVAAFPGAAQAQEPSSCYDLAATVLTAANGADLTLAVTAREGCAAIDALKKVQIKKYDVGGKLVDVENVDDVALTNGSATRAIGDAARGALVEADVLIDDGRRTWVVRSESIARLRPDLVVASITAPAQTLAVRPIDVTAEIAEVNEDVAATATVTLSWGPSVIATSQVEVPAGGSAPVVFRAVALTTPTAVELTARVSDVSPAETDETNNVRTATVDVTEFELARSRLILDNLGGYGSQFNQHVFARFTSPPPESLPDFEAKVKALEPQFVRIFYHVVYETDPLRPDNIASFIETVRLAHEAGATINITYHTAAAARLDPDPFMRRFADVLHDLVVTRGYTNVRWATIQNEPNTPGLLITLAQYEALNRALDGHLRDLGIRDRIGIMAGDLVESSGSRRHDVWFQYIVEHMNDITDAYSEHIYWNYWDIPRMEFRLRDVARLMIQDVPAAARKPVYITEFAVRGLRNLPGKTEPPGYWTDGTQITRTNISAFQQLWFNIVAAQLGFAGTSKWDTYWGVYDANRFGVPIALQSHWMIGPASEGWPLFPTYHAFRLLLQTTARGWHVVGIDPWSTDDWDETVVDQPEKELTAYAGPNGELTLIGLDTHARDVNGVSPAVPSYSVAGLPPLTALTLVVWNSAGNGENGIAQTVTTNAAGVARFDVPLHAAFALTTVGVA